MMDGEIGYKSLLYVTESLEKLIGANGAKAVLRSAGQRAARNLIEALPSALSEEEAIRRTGLMLVERDFIDEMKLISPAKVQVIGNHFVQEMIALGLENSISGRYYVIGLFEGFLEQLSGSKKKVTSINLEGDCEYWNLE